MRIQAKFEWFCTPQVKHEHPNKAAAAASFQQRQNSGKCARQDG
jgi:hypothetical protein